MSKMQRYLVERLLEVQTELAELSAHAAAQGQENTHLMAQLAREAEAKRKAHSVIESLQVDNVRIAAHRDEFRKQVGELTRKIASMQDDLAEMLTDDTDGCECHHEGCSP